MRQSTAAQRPAVAAQTVDDAADELDGDDLNSRHGVESMHQRRTTTTSEWVRDPEGTDVIGGDRRTGFASDAGAVSESRGVISGSLVASSHVRVVQHRIAGGYVGRWWSRKEGRDGDN